MTLIRPGPAAIQPDANDSSTAAGHYAPSGMEGSSSDLSCEMDKCQ